MAHRRTCPEGLSDAARLEFRRVVTELKKRGVFEKCDQGVVAAYASAIVRAREYEAILAAEGPIVPNRFGETKSHPIYKMLVQANSIVRMMARELGLTPNARGALRGRGASPEADDVAFLFGKKK